MELITTWVLEDRCQVVSVLGLGGIGKSALAVSLMHQLAEHFEVVIWRSLRDAPACEAFLDDCLQVLAPQPLGEVPTSLERRLDLLLEYLVSQRVLLVIDNFETLLEDKVGHRPLASWIRGLRQAAAQGGRQQTSELSAAHQPGETERPRVAGRQPAPGAQPCVSPGWRHLPASRCWLNGG